MTRLLLTVAAAALFTMTAFAQTNGNNKFDSVLAAKVREFKAKQNSADGATPVEEYVDVIIRHEYPQSDDQLRTMLAAKRGKLRKQITSINMSFAELPVSELEHLAAEPSVKRISFDASIRSGR